MSGGRLPKQRRRPIQVNQPMQFTIHSRPRVSRDEGAEEERATEAAARRASTGLMFATSSGLLFPSIHCGWQFELFGGCIVFNFSAFCPSMVAAGAGIPNQSSKTKR